MAGRRRRNRGNRGTRILKREGTPSWTPSFSPNPSEEGDRTPPAGRRDASGGKELRRTSERRGVDLICASRRGTRSRAR